MTSTWSNRVFVLLIQLSCLWLSSVEAFSNLALNLPRHNWQRESTRLHTEIRYSPGFVGKGRPNTSQLLRAVAAVDEVDATTVHSSLESETSLIEQQIQKVTDWVEVDRERFVSRFINGCFLAASFGVAVYSILNINQGMTRGWTQAEIAMRIPLDSWSSYEAALEASPVATKTMINVIIYLLGDWLSQTLFSKNHVLDFDLGRTLRNGFIGLCFGPLVHEYYKFSDAILPVEGGLENRLLKIVMDQTIYLSSKCSVYIMAVNILQGASFETSAKAVQERIGGICITAWKFWPLIHCITYSVIPARHRVLWVNCVDLVWNAILSTMSQQQKATLKKIETTDVETISIVLVAADENSNPEKQEVPVEAGTQPLLVSSMEEATVPAAS